MPTSFSAPSKLPYLCATSISVTFAFEIAVLRVRLLHVVDQLGKFILARIEVFQRVHHHARAVVVVLIVFWVDFIVRHGEVFAHCLFIVYEVPMRYKKRVEISLFDSTMLK